MKPIIHTSDCAMHSEPAYPAGPCNCGALDATIAGPVNPRDVLKKFAGDDYETTTQDREEFADQVIAALTAAGLFVGPLVATEDMRSATFLHADDAGEVWEKQVEVWRRRRLIWTVGP